MHLKEYLFKFNFIYNFFSVSFLMKLSRRKIIFPFYHFVDNGENKIVNNLYKAKNTKQFEEDIKFLKQHFVSVSLKEVLNNQIKENSFFISFDDGLLNYKTIVIPILEKHNLKAINFLNTNFINNQSLFFRYKVNILINEIRSKKLSPKQTKELKEIAKNSIFTFLKQLTQKEEAILDSIASIINFSFKFFLQEQTPYLSDFQIKKLIEKGFYFGAHSKSHPYYNTIPLRKQLEETFTSINYIKNTFAINNVTFAFPFSDFGVSKSFFKVMKEENIFTFGTAGLKDEAKSINNNQRIVMEYKDRVYSAETIIKGELILYLIKKLFGKHKIYRA